MKRRLTPAEAAAIPLADLKGKPFFDSDNPVPLVCAEPDNANGAGSVYARQNRAKLLAQMIPALSFATGANPLLKLNEYSVEQNINMNNMRNGWPEERQRREYLRNRWLHGDYRAVAYVYVYKVFDAIKDKGDLAQ